METMDKGLTLDDVRTNAVGKNLSREELDQFQVGSVEERMIPTRHGETHVYVYVPQEAKESYPVFINLHGGGFVKGHRDQDVVFCKCIAQKSGYVVIDIDYHTAPEYKYPYAIEESYDVVKYVTDHAEEFQADTSVLVLAGHSAGGNLICGVEFMALQEGTFKPTLMIMDYPPLDFTRPAGERRYAYAPFIRISVERDQKYQEWYIDHAHIRDIMASPVLAMPDELKDFPPVLMLIADDDTLSEDGVRFAAKLIDAGVTVWAKRVKGSSHGFTVRRTEGFEVAEAMMFEALAGQLKDKKQD